METRVPSGTFHLSEGDVHRTVGLADTAGVAFTRRLCVDANFELLALGHHEPVGADVKFDLDDTPRTTAAEWIWGAGVLELTVLRGDLRVAGFERERNVSRRTLCATELDVGRETSGVGSTASVDVEVADHFGATEFQAIDGAPFLLSAIRLDGGDGPLSTRLGGGGVEVEFVGLLRDGNRCYNVGVFKHLNR